MQWTIPLIITTIYLALVKALRFRRFNAARERLRRLKRSSTVITPSTAQEIVHASLLHDMPFFGRLGASTALFRTYGIPSIAETLLRTGEMSNESTISKRIADTAILISSFVAYPLADPQDPQSKPIPSDPRSSLAIARMNFIHSHYNISNEDMLYTLSVFIFQPMEVMGRYDWRAISPEELECFFILWRESMGIQEIPPTVDALRQWSHEYELQHMVPPETSHKLAQITLNHIRRRVPDLPGLRRLVSVLFVCLMDERLRGAMVYIGSQPHQHGPWAHWTVHIFCQARALFIRTCCLPRRGPSAYIALNNLPSGIGPDGRMRLYTLVRQFHPWYYPIPRDHGSGFGFRALYERIVKTLGASPRKNKFSPSAAFKAEGYRMEELGPRRYENDGYARVFAEAEKIHGAPIEAPWAR